MKRYWLLILEIRVAPLPQKMGEICDSNSPRKVMKKKNEHYFVQKNQVYDCIFIIRVYFVCVFGGFLNEDDADRPPPLTAPR